MKELKPIEEHKYKKLLRYYSVNQQVLARNLGISQAYLSNQLNGYRSMTDKVKNEIQELLDYEKFKEEKEQ